MNYKQLTRENVEGLTSPCVYQLLHRDTGMIYVGMASKGFYRRSKFYLSGRGHSRIGEALNANGYLAFDFKLLHMSENSTKEELLSIEQAKLDELRPFDLRGYNVSSNSRNPCFNDTELDRRRPVNQYCGETGDFIKYHTSARDAALSVNGHRKTILNGASLNHKSSVVKGYIWVFADEKCQDSIIADRLIKHADNLSRSYGAKYRAVTAWSIADGSILTFESTKAAGRFVGGGHRKKGITQCAPINTKRLSSYGYVWAYSDDIENIGVAVLHDKIFKYKNRDRL